MSIPITMTEEQPDEDFSELKLGVSFGVIRLELKLVVGSSST